MGSLRTIAAMIMVFIGVMEFIMEQSIGVIWEMAKRNVIWVRKNPSREAMNIFGKSLLSTFSAGKKSEIIQKRVPAPMERRQKRAIGEIILLVVRSLQMTIFSPNIR